MKIFATLLILFLTCEKSECSQEKIVEEFNLHPHLDILTRTIVSKLDPGKCFAIITDNQYYQLLRGPIFATGIEDYPIYLALVNDSEDLLSPNYNTVRMLQEIRKANCGIYVIYLANGIQMERFFRFGDKHRLLSSHAKYIILHDYRLYSTKMLSIWKKIINVIFVKQLHPKKRHNPSNSSSPWFELTTVPFPAPLKNIFVTKRVDYWQDGKFRYRVPLFEDKTKNLNEQLLKAAVLEHVPAVRIHIENQNDSNSGEFFAGVEVEMLKALAKALNFQVDFYKSPNQEIEKWGKFQLNGTFSGLLGEIVSGQSDFAIGDFHYTRYHLTLMDLTIPYDTECLTFLTPEILSDNSWKTLILPFSPEMWIGVCISLLSVGVIFSILSNFYIYIHHKMTPKNSSKKHFRVRNLIFWTNAKREIIMDNQKHKPIQSIRSKDIFDDFSNCILYTYSMILLVSLPRLPKPWAIRLLTGWYYIYCILLVVAYRASMTAILANPVARLTIDTMDQLAKSKLGCGAFISTQAKKFFLTSLDETSQIIGERLDEVISADEAVEKVSKGQYAFYENEHYLRKLRSGRNQEAQILHIMKECVIHMPIALGLQKNSPLKPTADKYVRRMVEMGLEKKWLSDTIEEFASSVEPPPEGAIVNLKKMTAAFVALGLGYFLAALALIGELIYFKTVTQKHPLYDKYNLAKYYEEKK
ncbi:glutamate receptor ionotropic, kainate glr-3 [Phlebotomus papatasi]|uniref:Ionotropic glutamate receptor L-glutamate and glycine-binding domain-containing protein n=1 Tax=Phlebotomus papatasi TaxID=29031 RepID=A0A8W9BC84_PHLPP|nr:glutamate receptor ionotropic, kainate glr-3 [Phlebotomus papatasi]